VVNGHWRGLDGDGILAGFGGGGNVDFSEGLVEPPRILLCGDGRAVAGDGIEVGSFDNDVERLGDVAFNGEAVGSFKAAAGRECPGDQLVAELDGGVPGVAVHTVLLEGELICAVEVDVLFGFAGGGNIDEVYCQDVRRDAFDGRFGDCRY